MDGVVRPKLVLTAALAHGWGTFLLGASELENHGANAWLSRTGLLRTVTAMCDHCCQCPISFPWQTEDHFCEVLSRVLDTVWKLAARASHLVPPHLVAVCGNTPAQAKNQFAI